MVAFEEFCRAKTCILFVRKEQAPPGHKILMSYPRSIGQDKRGNPYYKLNKHGQREGELDNEMADAVKELVGRAYRGTAIRQRFAGDSRLCFHVSQEAVRERGVLVPRFWWRAEIDEALKGWGLKNPSRLVTLGQLADGGIIETFEGHGSPPSNARATGDVPYVKVTDLKNWRINENPTNFIHAHVAEKLKKRGVRLQYGDLVTPARASSNIGQFSLVLPWQTHVVVTKEVLIIRVKDNTESITSFLLLALMSLKVVQEQYKTLALMQTNREHLGDHWREVQIPLPLIEADRAKIGQTAKAYFDGIVKARESWDSLCEVIDPTVFGTRP
jgi:type I restriction enzyme M protein